MGKSAETLGAGGDGEVVEGPATVTEGCDIVVTADVSTGRVAVEVRRGRGACETTGSDSTSDPDVEDISIVRIGSR